MKFGPFIACCGALQATLLAADSAQAQTAPGGGIGNAVRTTEQSRQAAPQPAVGVPVLPQLTEPLLRLKDKETLFVRRFEFIGPPGLVDEAAVQAILGPYENRKLTLAQIYAAADEITTLYRNQGYMVAKAYVPAQDARRGVLKIKLIPGQLGTVTVNNASLVRTEFLQGVIDHAIAGSTYIRKDELERAMLLVNDLPGAGTPHIAIEPGRQPETSNFLFDVPEGRRINGYLLGDNYGSPWTGRDRLSAGLDLNSPLGYGDRLSGYGIVSEKTHLANGRIAYSFPLGYDGIRGEIAGFHTTYTLGGKFAGLDATGIANGGSATVSYAIKRTREDSIYVSANFTYKGLDDKTGGVSFANRTIPLGTLAVSRDTLGFLPFTALPLTTSTSLSFTAGNVSFTDPAQQAANVAGANTAGTYERINLNFLGVLALNEQWSLSGNLKAQAALSRNLDTSEQLTLTGFWGVRSYDEGLSTDSGFVATPELKYALPNIYNYHHALGLFTDVGGGWLYNGAYTTTQKTFTELNDFGLGYYATYEYSPGRALLVKAQVAHTYGSENGADLYDRKTKGLVQVGMTF
ncbi:ShlB/FhaC/HecB family hemolysin secretion/activation protein [Methyloferula stellata]|uniref:ShlB/FhaC/HecB family hemolysin secretion/activation protein n=1 Tax=Methyloferula stellata TaxID=876270 RepID=UPI000369A89E|nr:ShlB/FhaC/HecB family hemolysin secretion/activation protein [Methyloferula stellata]